MKAKSRGAWVYRSLGDHLWLHPSRMVAEGRNETLRRPIAIGRGSLDTLLGAKLAIDESRHIEIIVAKPGTLRKMKALVAAIRRGIDNADDERVADEMASKAQVLVDELEGVL